MDLAKKIDANDSFRFNIKGFNKKSLTMLVVVLFSLALTLGGISIYLEFVAFGFVCFPWLYKKLRLQKISIAALKLSSSWLQILGYLPFVPSLKGTWFIERHSEQKELESVKDFLLFLYEHWFEFLVINAGLVALGGRIAFIIQSIVNYEASPGNIWGLSPWGILIAFGWVPFCLAIYFVWVWVWRDAELKIASVAISSKGRGSKDTPVSEVIKLWSASDSIRNLIALFASFSALSWFAENIPADYTATALLIGLIFATSGIAILMGTMYYRSGVHEEVVNNLREYIKRKNEEARINGKTYSVQIGTCTLSTDQLVLDSTI